MIPKMPATDLIRGGNRFSEKIMRKQVKPPPATFELTFFAGYWPMPGGKGLRPAITPID
jgi:hypothetical protein